MPHFEDTLREAGRTLRRVLVKLETTPGETYEREFEPYAIENGDLIVFSYLRNEYRTVSLGDIRGVEITPRSFTPRRPVQL